MVILIQKRNVGQQSGCYGGGTIIGGFRLIDKLESVPEKEWEEYLLEHFGDGEYMVTRCGGNKRIDVLFKGNIVIRPNGNNSIY